MDAFWACTICGAHLAGPGIDYRAKIDNGGMHLKQHVVHLRYGEGC